MSEVRSTEDLPVEIWLAPPMPIISEEQNYWLEPTLVSDSGLPTLIIWWPKEVSGRKMGGSSKLLERLRVVPQCFR